jgi:hypothetical protein
MSNPRKGRHYRLVLYTYILNRWWQVILGIGVTLLVLVAALNWLPALLPQYTLPQIADRVLLLGAEASAFAIFLAIFMIAIRKSAYVQPFDKYLFLVTPFLRMNIAYSRVRQASSAEMGRLFPQKSSRGQKRAYLTQLSKQTAIVLELNGWPLPRWVLSLFLSQYFFPDKTARIALVVPDWIQFSTEMESFRSAWLDSLRQPDSTPRSDLLASLSERR